MKKRINVLLIEDNPDDVELVKIQSTDMASGSLNITSASCLSEGIKLLSPNEFDLVLLDLFLPDSGVDKTLSVLHDITAKLPVIVMTGNNDEKFADQAVQQGAQDYLIRTGRLRHF